MFHSVNCHDIPVSEVNLDNKVDINHVSLSQLS